MVDFSHARRAMVDGQLRTNDVTNSDLLDAFTLVPREIFVDPAEQSIAYADRSVTAAGGTHRQILSPMCLGRMIQAAEIKPGAQVLDVAGGAGYSAAIMAALGAEVTLVEEEAEQAEAAKRILAQAHIKGVTVAVGPLASGGKKSAKYDAILVNGRCETVPELLLKKLSDGGRLVVISGNAVSSNVRVFTCTEGAIGEKRLMSAAGPALSAFSRVPEFVF